MSAADDAWGGDLPGVKGRELEGISAPANHDALVNQPGLMRMLSSVANTLRSDLEGALSAAGARGGDADLDVLQFVAGVQAVRRQLGEAEAIATRWLGLSATIAKTGVLPDGSTYEVKRGQNRKAWAHDSWKHDARAKVLERTGLTGHEVVDTETGELVDIQGLMTWLQELHGSANPRLTNLRQLGLDPDDYCESFPGLWGVQVTPAETSPAPTGSPE